MLKIRFVLVSVTVAGSSAALSARPTLGNVKTCLAANLGGTFAVAVEAAGPALPPQEVSSSRKVSNMDRVIVKRCIEIPFIVIHSFFIYMFLYVDWWLIFFHEPPTRWIS
jgi:hypothetical protein